MQISLGAKKTIESNFGEKFNIERRNLGLKEIPQSWPVAFHDDNYIYFSPFGDNSMTHRGFVGKEVEDDDNFQIVKDIDIYSSGNFVDSDKYEDGDYNSVSFIYDFKEREYIIDSQNCPECDSLLQIPWDSDYEGTISKLHQILDAWHLEKNLR